MADKKISELVSATDLLSTDQFLIVTAETNKKITAGVMCLNLPNIGNKGITKNLVGTATLTAVPTTSTIIKLSLPSHTLGAGTEGQEITLIGSGTNTVTLTGADTLTTISFPGIGSTCTVMYVNSVWYVKSSFAVTFA